MRISERLMPLRPVCEPSGLPGLDPVLNLRPRGTLDSKWLRTVWTSVNLCDLCLAWAVPVTRNLWGLWTNNCCTA